MGGLCKIDNALLRGCGDQLEGATYSREAYVADLIDYKKNAIIDNDGFITNLGSKYFQKVQTSKDEKVLAIWEKKINENAEDAWTHKISIPIIGKGDAERDFLKNTNRGKYVYIVVETTRDNTAFKVFGSTFGLRVPEASAGEGANANTTMITLQTPELSNGELYSWDRIKDSSSDTFATNEAILNEAVIGLTNCSSFSDVTGLTAIAGSEQITLSWTDPSELDLSKIEIEWIPKDGITQPLIIDSGVETANITGLTAGTEYSFTVKARYEDGGTSCGSNVLGTALV